MRCKYALLCLFVVLIISEANAAVSITSFTIAGGANFTADSEPDMAINATDATQMAFSCNDTNGPYVPYADFNSDFNLLSATGCNSNDGNKMVKLWVQDVSGNTATASDGIYLDLTAPSTTDDAPSGWGSSVIVKLTCIDSGSGCMQNWYQVNSSAPVISTSFPVSIPVINDGNNKVEYYSTDNVGNVESIKTKYVLVDLTPPQVAISEPFDGNSAVTSIRVTFDVNRISGTVLNKATIGVKLGSSASTSFSSNYCTEFNGDYHCSYTERGISSGTRYDLNVYAKDTAGNEGNKKITFTTATVDTAPAAPSGFSASPANNQVSLSWTASTEDDFNNYRIYRSTSNSFTGSSIIAMPTTVGYTDTAVSNSTAYYYWLSAVDKAGNESAASATSATPAPAGCSGGIAHDACSPTQPLHCDNGSLVNKCSECGCPSGRTCNSSTGACDVTGKCSDDTSINSCSSTKPKYCNSELDLVNDCERCGCPSDKKCDAGSGECIATGTCSLSITMLMNGEELPDYVKPGLLSVSVSATGGKMYDGLLKLYITGKGYKPNLDSGDAVYSLSGGYTLGDNDKRVLVEFIGTDSAGVACGIRQWADVDGVKPVLSIESLGDGDVLSGKVMLSAEASDANSGIKSVDFYIKEYGSSEWKQIASIGTRSTGIYQREWDSKAGAANGNAELKVEAKDNAGNITTKTIDVLISNELTGQEMAELAEQLADENRDNAVEFFNSLIEMRVLLPETIRAAKESAEEKMASVSELIIQGRYDEAVLAANEAARIYENMLLNVKVEEYASKSFTLNESEFESKLAASGLEKGLVDEALQMLENGTIERIMVIAKITQDGRTYYTANIVVRYKNNSGEEKDVQIAEVIPKSFAASASSIYSGKTFSVLREDPVIKFGVGKVGAGKEVEIVYALGRELTQSEADMLLSDSAASGFLTPLIVLGSGAALGEGSFGFALDIGWLVGNIAVVLGVIVIALVIAIAMVMRSRGGSGSYPDIEAGADSEYGELEPGILEAIRKVDSPITRAGMGIRSIGKKQKPRRASGRFAYKERK